MISNIDMENFIKDFSCNCKNVQKKAFKKGQTITTYIQKRNQICILAEGEADLVRYDLNGNKSIIEHFTKNDIFGEALYIVTTNNELSVLSENFSELILNKITHLNTRIEILTKRTIREKLLGYFSIMSSRNLNKTFSMPFSLTDLADYLSVDRSAMMRELRFLKDEGFIKKSGNKITLLY